MNMAGSPRAPMRAPPSVRSVATHTGGRGVCTGVTFSRTSCTW